MRFVKEEGTCLISRDGKKLLSEGGQDHTTLRHTQLQEGGEGGHAMDTPPPKLICHSHNITLNTLKHTGQWFLQYSQRCATITST